MRERERETKRELEDKRGRLGNRRGIFDVFGGVPLEGPQNAFVVVVSKREQHALLLL